MLKTIALVSMLIDHVAHALLHGSNMTFSIAGTSIKLYDIMRKIGRLAFPIYCFLLVEGFLHTRDRKRYAIRLLVFAVISEIPWNLEHAGTILYAGQNVFFTLFIGLMGIWCLDCIEEKPLQMGGGLVVLYFAALFLKVDYGVTGYGFILMMYLLRNRRLIQAVLGSCILSSTWAAGLAFIPINLYNGERGYIKSKILKYAFYAIYPIHLLLLYYIKLKTIGF